MVGTIQLKHNDLICNFEVTNGSHPSRIPATELYDVLIHRYDETENRMEAGTLYFNRNKDQFILERDKTSTAYFAKAETVNDVDASAWIQEYQIFSSFPH